MEMTQYQFSIFHINGIDNVWADLLSRLGAGLKEDTAGKMEKMGSHLADNEEDANILPDDSSTVMFAEAQIDSNPQQFMVLHEVEKSQLALKDTSSFMPNEETKLYENNDNRIIIPETAIHLRLMLCVIAHAGPGDGKKPYFTTIEEVFLLAKTGSRRR